jgi:hypothetical protein
MKKGLPEDRQAVVLAGPTRLELATSGSTVRCSNQIELRPLKKTSPPELRE